MEPGFEELLTAFGLDPGDVGITPVGTGHIHDTYLVERSGPPLMLQRMNHHVFRDIPLLMRNLEIVTGHIADRNRQEGKNPAEHGILLIEADGGRSWIEDSESGYWRMFWYIENQVSYEVASTTRIAEEGGKGVAHFQEMLSDLEPGQIGESIPGFHDFGMRMEKFERSLQNGSRERLEQAAEMISYTRANADHVADLYKVSADGGVPLRLTHNDTKFNNMLFDASGKVTCLIDLDTVMPGYAWFDFGDAMRTSASRATEEETDLSKVGFRAEIFEAFARGYLGEAKFLTDQEADVLHRAPHAFAFMQGLRFLTDYLENDAYYKTGSPNHNLERTRNQYVLAGEILKQEEGLRSVIRSLRRQEDRPG